MLATKIIQYMEARKYQIFRGNRELNIVYVEGMNTDGTLNGDEPNHFNDVRMVIEFNDKVPIVSGKWQATTEPGFYYTDNPMNPSGAARIAFGQYKAWQVGIHGMSEPHEALVQVDWVKVHRDYNRDMLRTRDDIYEGNFGINQHHGYDHPQNDIYTASAGCLVGRTRAGHAQFMNVIKSDRRYQADPNFIFTTTIIPGNKL
ncbi:MAG: hypothetical protein EAZ73_09230 [Oscillatoriales cyanobacterium]|uniref:hypothetical protein n=1 Tax=unclassified Microcoleus TaxID=2642155 RepID=UPI001E1911B8|nr:MULTISPECIES: hypothetical protein [unclassified Microcoleus]TAF00844.1 MAG: hypothetical protein EAZ79_01365 [Oscillatoriales cyanobacterium]MCC3459818.1 hypothetical protein [Microcoleus sp. PH2017_11_PCY_U_A]MCC3478252.1 hypothetical protein [Microcoleus sp. PH2017_12_PCY_D_A]TAF21397.1 MAG: hypothetical protein EAZ73_09230 [Oscillatoriales cyanobacterium]TAF39676.1 MAG: hypothetical protein EAZ69_00115 [Oscillatoriales cyanobacterium]